VGGYANPDFDRLAIASDSTPDRSERIGQLVQMERILSVDVPAIFQYNTPSVVAHTAALTGPTARRVPEAGSPAQNMHLWEWRS
jgi:ABC-type oligopeptide transport system substrate-binding subunit